MARVSRRSIGKRERFMCVAHAETPRETAKFVFINELFDAVNASAEKRVCNRWIRAR